MTQMKENMSVRNTTPAQEQTAQGAQRQMQSSAQTRKKKKKHSLFFKGYMAYLFLIFVLCIALFLYVRGSLILYEKSQPDRFMEIFTEELAESGGARSELAELCFSEEGRSLSPLDNPEIQREQFCAALENAEKLTFAPGGAAVSAGSEAAYQINADGTPLCRVALAVDFTETRLGILTVSPYVVQRAEAVSGGDFPRDADGSFSCEIAVPEGYRVTLNGTTLGEKERTGENAPFEQLRYAAEYAEVPQAERYRVEKLAFSPLVEIFDTEGKAVEFSASGGRIEVPPRFAESAEAEEMAKEVDALAIAELWSRLMTDDIGGARHGVAKVQQYLIPGSYLSDMANDYAGSVDITFVSKHTLSGFANERVTNYTKYSDDCFSCDVYFEKQMMLYYGEARTDVFNSRCYFVRVTDGDVAPPGWYLVDMQALVEE